jgi:hypothetical protein
VIQKLRDISQDASSLEVVELYGQSRKMIDGVESGGILAESRR